MAKPKTKTKIATQIVDVTPKLKVKPKRLEKDCLDCSRYLSCKNEGKAVNFICSKFRERDTLELSEVFSFGSNTFSDSGSTEIDFSDVEGEKNKNIREIKLELDQKINVSSLINSVLESDLLTPVDTKIDDSSVPMAKNFYEFTTDSKFLGVKPYLFQMLYITQLFSEYCPKCSDLNWMLHSAKVSDSLATFREKVVCLEFGVCPNCGARKSDLVRNGELNYYQELAGLAGQRCITEDSIVHTKAGLKYVKEFVNKEFKVGFNTLELDNEYPKIISPNLEFNFAKSLYKSEETQTYNVILKNGISIIATAEHPIKTVNGYMPVAALPDDVEIPITYGFDGFGDYSSSSNAAHFFGYYLASGEANKLNNSSRHAFSVVKTFYEGKEVVWGCDSITLPDQPEFDEIISAVMKFDRTSTILFLRAFLTHQTNEFSKTVTNLVLLQLQMVGLPSYLDFKCNKVFVDYSYHFRAENLLGAKLPVGEKLFEAYTYDDKNTFHIPLLHVTKAEIATTYDFVVDCTESFLANGIDNHNSGKSAIVAMSCAYVLHKQIKLQQPNEIYGLLPANVLHGTFVALTYKQAAETLWEPFLSYITDSPWFCIEENSLIDLQCGLQKAIKDIVAGDLVKTSDGYSAVTRVFDNGVKQCYELTLSNGAKIVSTEQHKFGKYKDNSFYWTPLSNLKIGDTIAIK